jgi:hypothetical protein
MAIQTVLLRAPKFIGDCMAFFAFNFQVLTKQLKIGYSVIKLFTIQHGQLGLGATVFSMANSASLLLHLAVKPSMRLDVRACFFVAI